MKMQTASAPLLMLLASIPCFVPACRCSQDPEVLSHDAACDEIGYSLANRTVNCGESAQRGNEVFEEFTSSFSCNAAEPAADAAKDASGSFVSILDCAEAMLLVSCDLLVGPGASLRAALESSPACINAIASQDGGSLVAPCESESLTRCGDECVNLDGDDDHCGACDHRCPGDKSLHYAGDCKSGVCTIMCLDSHLDCDNDAANGCEVNRLEDIDNCAGCGVKCAPPSYPGQQVKCEQGFCVYPCDATHLDCDADPFTGCEIAVGPDNCFLCGYECTKGGLFMSECVVDAGGCVTQGSCTTGTLNCDAVLDCETTYSVLHCGLCNKACPAGANADPRCTDGVCALECLPGFLDCNAESTDGCETEASACP